MLKIKVFKGYIENNDFAKKNYQILNRPLFVKKYRIRISIFNEQTKKIELYGDIDIYDVSKTDLFEAPVIHIPLVCVKAIEEIKSSEEVRRELKSNSHKSTKHSNGIIRRIFVKLILMLGRLNGGSNSTIYTIEFADSSKMFCISKKPDYIKLKSVFEHQ